MNKIREIKHSLYDYIQKKIEKCIFHYMPVEGEDKRGHWQGVELVEAGKTLPAWKARLVAGIAYFFYKNTNYIRNSIVPAYWDMPKFRRGVKYALCADCFNNETLIGWTVKRADQL